ncbi:MAG: FAD-dependent monooxygenase [Planctomycetaceae bacterium]|nr:FAD-dependent monooxygenase [Planctomycetaceae bacterium]
MALPTDFLIVGGGIGGLVLAELVGRGGKRVVVLERSAGPPPWNRPEVLWPATIELLSSLVPESNWKEQAAVPLAGVKLWTGKHFAWAFSPELLERAGVHPWSTDPNQSRELLMRLGSFELHRGVEVKSVLKEGGRIVGVQAHDISAGQDRDWLAEITVGDDGANSLVRAASGIELAARVFPRDLVCFQCDWPASLQRNAGHLWPNLARPQSGILAVGLLPAPGPRGMGVIPTSPTLSHDQPRADREWQALIQTEPTLDALMSVRKFPDDFQRVRRPWGHASRYGAPGALLMGDAAHPVSPAGGQGANMSIADGRAIAELALAGERDLLAAYERNRRPANRRSLRFTRGAAFVFGLPEWLLPPSLLFWLVRQFGTRPWLLSRFIRAASTAFVARGSVAKYDRRKSSLTQA